MVSRKETFDPPEQIRLGFSQDIIQKHPILKRYIKVVNGQPDATPETKRNLVLYAVFCRLGQDQKGVLIEYSNHTLSIEDITGLLCVSEKDVKESQDFMYTEAGLDLWKKYEKTGYYMDFVFEAETSVPLDFEKKMLTDENVLRHLLIRRK